MFMVGCINAIEKKNVSLLSVVTSTTVNKRIMQIFVLSLRVVVCIDVYEKTKVI
jgi:hypothetical protein